MKVSLSCFDDKPFILSDGVNTIPYGHYTIREDVYHRQIAADQYWGYDEFLEEDDDNQTPPENNSTLPPQLGWTPYDGIPDPGMFQSDLEDDQLSDIVDFDKLSDNSSDNLICLAAPNEFIIFEATEDNESAHPLQKSIVLNKNEIWIINFTNL